MFGKHGVQESDVDTLWRVVSDTASWVDAHHSECDWVNPHVRWVPDVEAADDGWRFKVDR